MGNFFRTFCLWLDNVVYSLIALAYNLILDIAKIDVLKDTTVNAFADRVYALLAVFMLFRLSFSILTYIINPDNSTDKSAGAGKLIGNVLITLVMLISAPWLFNQARAIQKSLLDENIVGKIILGTTKTTDFVSQQIDPGASMAWTTFEAFFKLEDWADGSMETSSGLTANEAYERAKKSKDINFVQKSGMSSLTACPDGNTTCSEEQQEFVFKYLPLISTITGAFIAYILILFSFQIAVRSVKLSFLQLIAPIPIISYIDPKQGKDGMFKKWYKLCLKTYADLFIRLAAIYFAVFVISEIPGTWDNITDGNSGLVTVIIIIGALMFAKELPKFIEEITGVKLSGGFSLNPFKNNALLGGFVGGALGAGLGAVGGFAGNLAAGNGAKNALIGGVKGFTSGGIGGIKDKGLKKDTFTRGAKAGVTTGTNYANWDAAGSNWRGRLSDRAMSSMGAKTAAQRLDDKVKVFDDMAKFRDDMKNQANYDNTKGHADFIVNDKELSKTDFGKMLMYNTKLYDKYNDGGTKALKQNYDDLVNSNASQAQIEEARVAWEEAQKYSITNGTTTELQAMKADMERYVKENKSVLGDNKVYKVDAKSSYDDINKAYAQAKQDSVTTKSSSEYRSAKANANANKEAKASKK